MDGLFAVPGGILLCIVGIYLALKNIGWSNIISYKGSGEISFAAGVTMILGMNVSQFVISADYTRYAKPCWKDNILIPIGIVAIGIPLLLLVPSWEQEMELQILLQLWKLRISYLGIYCSLACCLDQSACK